MNGEIILFKQFTKAEINNQVQFLSDKNSLGKERPWRDKKIKNMLLEECYLALADGDNSDIIKRPLDYYHGKAERLNSCSTHLEFNCMEDGSRQLAKGYFCQIGLCPICSWRKEMKVRVQLGKVVAELLVMDYRFIFLTLTCKNVDAYELSSAIDALYTGIYRMFKLRPVKRAIDGYFRALEVTHDSKRKITRDMYASAERRAYYDSLGLKMGDFNPNFNKYHPHFHVMIAVKPDYFKRKNGLYISQEEWTDYWMQSLRVDYKPIVDVRAVKNAKDKGILEVAKYTVKDSEYIIKQDKPLTLETVLVLDDALHHRRLIGYSGVMKKIHKQLNLDEDVRADVLLDEESSGYEAVSNIVECYKWHVGYKNYVFEKKI